MLIIHLLVGCVCVWVVSRMQVQLLALLAGAFARVRRVLSAHLISTDTHTQNRFLFCISNENWPSRSFLLAASQWNMKPQWKCEIVLFLYLVPPALTRRLQFDAHLIWFAPDFNSTQCHFWMADQNYIHGMGRFFFYFRSAPTPPQNC